MAKSETFFRRLTQLFRSGPAIRRRVKGQDFQSYYDSKLIQGNFGYRAPAPFGFGRENSPFSVMGAYGILDRMSRYAEFAEMEYSLHPDTKIATDGGYVTIKELAERCSKDPDYTFVVYSYDHNKGEIVPALGKQARKTCHDDAYKITFDNGTYIIGSFNHRLMQRDGTYRLIKDLKPGDAMMPFYRRSVASDRTEGKEGCYQTIYTVGKKTNTYGWVAEHKLLAEFILGRPLKENEVVHHKNFKPHDNRIENLEIMTVDEHRRLHAKILNGKKWNYETNSEWIEEFKKRHSEWMKNNNPAERKDIGFWKILEVCEREGFNLRKVCHVFDTDPNTIKRKLKSHGYNNFKTFAEAYCHDYNPNSTRRKARKFNLQHAFSVYDQKDSLASWARKLNMGSSTLLRCLQRKGYENFTDFKKRYANLKVVSVEYVGKMDLYDLTVDGYKNFATDSVISHNTPEIASALDIYADETVGGDERGKSFHIYSDNINIKRNLEELFYDILNIEFNLRAWSRNLVKYGDFFLYNEVLPEVGVINVQPIPVNEIEREEGYDKDDPYAVRFKWLTRGNVLLENWQVTHMRILGNDLFLPYGTSVLESARRIWRQLTMMEDAMLVYRVVRSPERRVFYIDVANVAPNDVPSYMEAAKATLRSHSVIEKSTGRADGRYNPPALDEDYYVPVRGTQSGTRIETLAGGQHVTATEDVQYIQSKLFAALKVPKPYLNYDENLSSKATLAQEDIRFSRTIASIQRIILAEMNKLAMIHLFAKGFDGEDLIDFELKLSNPSSVAVQQKLELLASKADVAGTLKDTALVDEKWIQKNILELTEDEISLINKGLYEDRVKEVQLDSIAFETEIEDNSTTDTFSPANYKMGGENVPKAPPIENETSVTTHDKNTTTISLPPGNKDDDSQIKIAYTKGSTPVKATPFLTRHRKNRKRRVGQGGRSNLANPDFSAMLNPKTNRSLKDVFDMDFLGNPTKREGREYDGEHVTEEFIPIKTEPVLPNDIKSILSRMKSHFESVNSKKKLLTEGIDLDIEQDEDESIIEFVTENEDSDAPFQKMKLSLKEVLNEIDEENNEDSFDIEIE